MKDPIRVFIGTSPNGEDAVAEMAYEYSIRKHASREVEIIWMRQTKDPTSFWYGFDSSRWGTPFSGFRWAIPEYCNYKGRAIYTDADMLNFCDMAELFDLPMDNKLVLARSSKRFGKEFCVMLIDCEGFKGRMTGDYKAPNTHGKWYSLLNEKSYKWVGDLDSAWNSLDGDVRPFKQLHFTNMLTQPWHPSWFQGVHKPHKYPDLEVLFWKMVEEAKAAGYNEDDYNLSLNPDHIHVPLNVKRGYY